MQQTQNGVTLTGVSIGYTGQAANETVTINIAVTVTCVPPSGQGANAAFVATQENSQLDAQPTMMTKLRSRCWVLRQAKRQCHGSSEHERHSATNHQRNGTATVQPSRTAAPTAKPSTPAGLPDTGAGNTTTLMLVLAARVLLASGIAAQSVLRRRTR